MADMEAVELKFKAVRGAGVNFAAHLATAFIQIAGVIVLARILTPRDFGLVVGFLLGSGLSCHDHHGARDNAIYGVSLTEEQECRR